MKKLLIISAATMVAMTASVFGQGTVIFGNSLNTSLDSTATSNGLVWTNDGKGGIGLWDGWNYNLSATLSGGPSTDSLTPLATYLEQNMVGDYTGFGSGQFMCTFNVQRVVTVPGIPAGGTAWLKLELWWSAGGPYYPTYEAAKLGGTAFFGEAIWQQDTANPVGPPPEPPGTLTGMPAIVMMVPEPSMFALAGLGLAGLLIFRRRK